MSVLQLTGITVTFGGLVAVDDLSLSVGQGEVRGLIGPNGSGKSTTLNVVSGLYRPGRGSVRLLGEDITRRDPAQRVRLGLARTFQNIRLFPRLPVWANVAAGRYCRTRAGLLGVLLGLPAVRAEEAETRRAAMEALKMVGLAARAGDHPRDLPYGQQRLVELARALCSQPKVLLLDEPAAGMNAVEKQNLVALIGRLNRELGLTIVLVDHDMGVVMKACHRISVLNFGKKIAEGVADAVRRDRAVLEAYLGRQGAARAGG